MQLPSTTATSIEGLRVAVWADDPFCETDTEYVALLHAVADTLRAGGASVDHAARPAMTFEDMFAVFRGNLGPSLRGQGVPLRGCQPASETEEEVGGVLGFWLRRAPLPRDHRIGFPNR